MGRAEGSSSATGEARLAGFPGANPSPPRSATLELEADQLCLSVSGVPPIRAAYRDLETVAVEQGTLLIVLGSGQGSEAWLLDRFGDRLGPVAAELRDRRLRQRLGDAFAAPSDDRPFELVEFLDGTDGRTDGRPGTVGQLAVHPWGFVLAPLDERVPWARWRRADIERVDGPAPGRVRLRGGGRTVELVGLGDAAGRHAERLDGLRRAAFDDAARLIQSLLPDAPFGERRLAAGLLVDGRPVDRAALGGAWDAVERAILVDETFAASYRALLDRAGGSQAPCWMAMSPQEPGGDEARTWFMVPLAGNLLALELVNAGAHATYCFRLRDRAGYRGETPAQMESEVAAAVSAVSEGLVDARFLREPLAIPAAQLAEPRFVRYRLALRAVPSLAAARARFVARVVHKDEHSWSAAIDDLIAWHGSCRDDAVDWPGRAAQEAEVEEASASNGPESSGAQGIGARSREGTAQSGKDD